MTTFTRALSEGEMEAVRAADFETSVVPAGGFYRVAAGAPRGPRVLVGPPCATELEAACLELGIAVAALAEEAAALSAQVELDLIVLRRAAPRRRAAA